MAQTEPIQDAVTFIDASPSYAVDDIRAAISFYTDKLGFSVIFAMPESEGDPPGYAIVGRGPVNIHFMPAEAVEGRGVSGGHGSISVEGIDALYAEYVANGVTMTRELYTNPEAGIKGFVLQDPEGNELGVVEVQGR